MLNFGCAVRFFLSGGDRLLSQPGFLQLLLNAGLRAIKKRLKGAFLNLSDNQNALLYLAMIAAAWVR
ncbi:hypothetical protein [Morganella psychrotolerans]|uniref:hypothetical protein n=1 Tax=Morganella psychrotolerans TaxID=368603 RepID=UPI0039AE9A59